MRKKYLDENEDGLNSLTDANAPYDSISERGPIKQEDNGFFTDIQNRLSQSMPSYKAPPNISDIQRDAADLERRTNQEAADAAIGNNSGPVANPAIKAAILNKAQRKLDNPLTVKPDPVTEKVADTEDYRFDPLMDQFDESQDKLDDYRMLKNDMDFHSNWGLAAQGLSAGVAKPEINRQLYSNFQAQDTGGMRSMETDRDRRMKVMDAIEARKSREQIASEANKNRLSIASENAKTRAAQAAENRAERANKFAISRSDKDAANQMKTTKLLGDVSSRLNSDPIIKPSEQNLASLDKALMILSDVNIPITPQVLSDAENDIASAMSLRSQGLTEGKIARTETETFNRMMARAKQTWGDNPAIDLRKKDPKLIEQTIRLNRALREDYKNALKERYDKALDRAASIYADTPQMTERIEKLRTTLHKEHGGYEPMTPEEREYFPGITPGPAPGSRTAPVPSPSSQSGETMYDVIGPDGRTRSIPESGLAAALAAGGKFKR